MNNVGIDLTKIKNFIFDLGGVIITLDINTSIKRYQAAGVKDVADLLNAYHQNGIFLELEEGRITASQFYEHLREHADKFIADEVLQDAMFGFVKEVPEYKLELLEQLRAKGYNLYLLSNTNPVLMDWAFTTNFSTTGKSLDKYFDKMYLSYQIGYCKPNPKIYEYMINDSGLMPAESLFIDDGLANINAGKEHGLQTYLATNGEDFRHIFKSIL